MLIVTFSHYTELLYTCMMLVDDLSFKNVGGESKDFACLHMSLFMPIVSFTEQNVKLCISFATSYTLSLCKPHFENRHTTVNVKF